MATSSLEHVLHLFDSTWFQHQIIARRSPEHQRQAERSLAEEPNKKPKLLDQTAPTIVLVRSSSDQQILISSGTSFLSNTESPTSVLPTSRLTTIFSGKEASELDENESKQEADQLAQPVKTRTSKMSVRWQRRNRASSSTKSLTDLEFEELKGFMDLGFVFSDKDRTDTDLFSIVPGLQRLGRKSENGDAERLKLSDAGSVVHRPYLSEAWEAMEKKEAVLKPAMIMKQKIKEVGLENERVMKEQIKFWAHSVASSIR